MFKKINNFYEPGVVHPMVELIIKEYGLTWKKFGEMLYENQTHKGNAYINKISASLARRLSVSKTKAQWFWPEVASIFVGIWNKARFQCNSLEEQRVVDINYSAMISEDLAKAYEFYYDFLNCPDEANCIDALRSAMALANTFINDYEIIFEIDFPDIQNNHSLEDIKF